MWKNGIGAVGCVLLYNIDFSHRKLATKRASAASHNVIINAHNVAAATPQPPTNIVMRRTEMTFGINVNGCDVDFYEVCCFNYIDEDCDKAVLLMMTMLMMMTLMHLLM